MADDYKRSAASARKAGGSVRIDRTYGTVEVRMPNGEERFFDDWQADEFLTEMKRNAGGMLNYISLEGFILASTRDW